MKYLNTIVLIGWVVFTAVNYGDLTPKDKFWLWLFFIATASVTLINVVISLVDIVEILKTELQKFKDSYH